MKKRCSGSITVFCSMIFPLLLIFLVSLFYCGKHQAVKTSIRNDLDAAGFSVLAEYDSNWVREYGLYMVPKSEIEKDMKYYMEENRVHYWGSYRIEKLMITQMNSLQDKAELQEQIIMFMKERGLLELAEDIGSTVLQIKELDQQVEEEVNWKESNELLMVQQLYGELVTLFEGIRSDGNKNMYSINYLLDEEPTVEEVLEVLRLEKPNSEQVGILERAYDELDHVAMLCEEACGVGSELEKAIGKLETTDEIPVTEAQLREHRNILKDNQKLCQDASKEIQYWISLLIEAEQPEEMREKVIEAVESLEKYERSIKLPYEYRESDESWDFSAIMSSLKGYPFDIGELAPDEDLDLELEQEPEQDPEKMDGEEEIDLKSITISESFGDQLLVTEYILGMFQNFEEAASLKREEGRKTLNLRGEEKKSRFFINEVEYLLIGKLNEYKNVNGTKNYMIALRSVLNMVHLLTDSEKRAEIELMAGTIGGILLPGIGNGIFFAIILAIWSWGEAMVDYQILVEGGEVPILKTRESWRTDLSAILSLDIPDVQENPGKGMNYKQYLRLMLYTVEQEKLLARVQNLLYLNHQKQSLTEAVTCFVVEGTAMQGLNEFSFVGEYEYGSYDQ